MLWILPVQAATLVVGQDHPTIAETIAASSPGDTIEIPAGTYTDDTVVFPHGDLVVRGTGGERPKLVVSEDIPNRKGIFVIPVDAGPVTIEGLHFEGARVSDADGGNGAGVRMQGTELLVRDCLFRDNQMGLLAGGSEDFHLHVEVSEFDDNGREGSGYEHNIYVGTDDCAEFTFVGNSTHHARSGHNLKSRCRVNNIVYNRIMDEAEGSSSYAIDLPEGGLSVVMGNLIQQGPMVENSSAILSYGAEGDNPEMGLYVAHNTLVNDRESEATAFVRATRADTVVLRNNLFVGAGTPLSVLDEGALIDDEGSLHLAEDGAGLADREGYDYRLLEGSPAIDAGVEVSAIDGQFLSPSLQYLHPLDTEPRWDAGPPDIGAYGFGSEPEDSGGDSSAPQDSQAPEAPEPEGCGCAGGPLTGGWVLVVLGMALSRRGSRRR